MYWALADRVGSRYATWAIWHVDARRVAVLYRQNGWSGSNAARRRAAPSRIREVVATQVGRRWTWCIWGEVAAGMALGPAGPVVAVPGLLTILFLWGAELAYVYGLDPQEPQRTHRLRFLIGDELTRCMTGHPRFGRPTMGQKLWELASPVLGFSRDLTWACRIIARVRAEWRDAAEAGEADPVGMSDGAVGAMAILEQPPLLYDVAGGLEARPGRAKRSWTQWPKRRPARTPGMEALQTVHNYVSESERNTGEVRPRRRGMAESSQESPAAKPERRSSAGPRIERGPGAVSR